MQIGLLGFNQPILDQFVSAIQEKGIENVYWGIRPEHIQITDRADPNNIPARIEVVEPLGSRQLVFVKSDFVTFTILEDAAIRRTHNENCYPHFPSRHVQYV